LTSIVAWLTTGPKRFTELQVGNIAGVRHGVVTDGLKPSKKGCCGVGGKRIVILM
jgi:hypothetical protein